MAKDKLQESNTGGTKGKVTVVMFQLEGSDDTLRDAIKVLGQGIEKLSMGGPVYYRGLPAPSVQSNGAAALPPPQEAHVIEPEYSEPEEAPAGDAAPSSQDNADRPKRRRIQKAVVPVKDVDWESDKAFREYAKEKKPDNAQERYLVVAGWFKNHRNVSVITPGHIVAAFDVMDWTKPENIPHIFAVVKNSKEWFDKGAKPNEWVVAQRGLNQLDRLGREGAQ